MNPVRLYAQWWKPVQHTGLDPLRFASQLAAMMTENADQLTALIPAWVDGKLTAVGKLDVHLRGLRHKAISVFIMNNDRTLIQRRALGKYHTPGLWANSCCTHPHWDEAPLDCAIRRLEQELGITGLAPEFRDQLEYRADVGGGLIEHELVDVFICEAPADLIVSPNPDEVMDYQWVDLTDLKSKVTDNPDAFTPWLKIYLDQHCTRIFGQ